MGFREWDEIMARQAIRDAVLEVLSVHHRELSTCLSIADEYAKEIGEHADRILELNPENEEIKNIVLKIKEDAERIRGWLDKAFDEMKYTERDLERGWLYELGYGF